MSIFNLIKQIPEGCINFCGVIVIMSLIEISPIKVNPWRWLQAFVELPKRMTKLETAFEKDQAYRWKRDILRFADINRRIPDDAESQYSKEFWDDIMDSMGLYDGYCRNNGDYKNGKTVAAEDFLIHRYNHLLDKNLFLK